MKSLILELSGKKIKIEVEKEAFVLSEIYEKEEVQMKEKPMKKEKTKRIFPKIFEGVKFFKEEVGGVERTKRTREYMDFLNERAKFYRGGTQTSEERTARAKKAWETRKRRLEEKDKYEGLAKLGQNLEG